MIVTGYLPVLFRSRSARACEVQLEIIISYRLREASAKVSATHFSTSTTRRRVIFFFLSVLKPAFLTLRSANGTVGVISERDGRDDRSETSRPNAFIRSACTTAFRILISFAECAESGREIKRFSGEGSARNRLRFIICHLRRSMRANVSRVPLRSYANLPVRHRVHVRTYICTVERRRAIINATYIRLLRAATRGPKNAVSTR